MSSFDLTSLSSLPLLVGRPLTLLLLFGRKTKKRHSCPSSCRDYTGHHFRSLPPRVATPNSVLRGTRAHLQGAPQSGTDCVINRGPDGQNLMLPPGMALLTPSEPLARPDHRPFAFVRGGRPCRLYFSRRFPHTPKNH